jgi:RNA polymerase sigma factor (sigma-70 family)
MRRIGNQVLSTSDCLLRRDRGQNDDRAVQVEQEEQAVQEDIAARAATLRADVSEALAGLTSRQRDIVQLVVQEGMTMRQAAQRLGIGIATLHHDYHLAQDRLAEKLDKYRLRQ